jgi:hypothetical protein
MAAFQNGMRFVSDSASLGSASEALSAFIERHFGRVRGTLAHVQAAKDARMLAVRREAAYGRGSPPFAPGKEHTVCSLPRRTTAKRRRVRPLPARGARDEQAIEIAETDDDMKTIEQIPAAARTSCVRTLQGPSATCGIRQHGRHAQFCAPLHHQRPCPPSLHASARCERRAKEKKN